MLEQLRKAREEESGFTLIELLIVIVILGVLAGVVVFAVNGINDRGQTAACRADLKTIEVAQEAHYAKFTAYAGSVAPNRSGHVPGKCVSARVGSWIYAK